MAESDVAIVARIYHALTPLAQALGSFRVRWQIVERGGIKGWVPRWKCVRIVRLTAQHKGGLGLGFWFDVPGEDRGGVPSLALMSRAKTI